MFNILRHQLRHHLVIGLKNSRALSGLKSELDPNIQRIKRWKRFFSISLFGITLTTALLVKNYKKKQWFELMEKTKRLQGQKFGDLELYIIDDIVIAEPVIKSWNNIQSFEFREDDLLLTAFPKSGITWLQEIVWIIDNDLDFKTAKSKSITERFPFFEFPTPGLKTIDRLKSRRFIKTHLTPSLLFKDNQLDIESNESNKSKTIPKMITIFRNPKDLIVSYYHFSRMNQMIGYKENFNDFFNRFFKGSVPYGPVWNHYLDAINWNSSHSEDKQILVIYYEDLKKDFVNQINRITEFLGKSKLSEEDIKALEFHCSFDEMKFNPSVNYKYWDDLGFRDKNESEFMRRGQIGDWKYYLSDKQNTIIDQLISDKLENKIKFIYE